MNTGFKKNSFRKNWGFRKENRTDIVSKLFSIL